MAYISYSEYSTYLKRHLASLENDVLRDYAFNTFSGWSEAYIENRLISCAIDILSEVHSVPYSIYIEDPKHLAIAQHILSIRELPFRRSFTGFILEDNLYRQQFDLPLPYKTFKMSKADGGNIFSISGRKPPSGQYKLFCNDYMERFIDISRFDEIKAIKLKSPDKRLILFIDYRNSQSMAAIARHIRQYSSAITSIGLLKDLIPPANAYDYTLSEPFYYLWPLVIDAIGPDAFHINVGWGSQGIPFIPFVNRDRTVIDFYDVLTFINDSSLDGKHPEPLILTRSSEEFLLSKFQNIVHRCFEPITKKLKLKYPETKNITSVIEYVRDPVYHCPHANTPTIKLVYGGILVKDITSPEDPHLKSFIEMVKYYSKRNLHLYLYPSPYLYGFEKSNAVSQLIEYYGLKNVHLCNPLSEDDFVRDIAQYDFGVFVPTPPDRRPSEYDYIVPFKFFSYLRAGLPILVSEDIVHMTDIIKDNGIGVVYGFDDCDRMAELLAKQDINLLKANVIKFREKLRIDIAAEKAISLYRNIFCFDSNKHSITPAKYSHCMSAPCRLEIPDTGYLSFQEYNTYIDWCIAGSDKHSCMDRDYIRSEFDRFLFKYSRYQMMIRALSILHSLANTPYYIYLEDQSGLEILGNIIQIHNFSSCAGFSGVILSDILIETSIPDWLSSYKIFPESSSPLFNPQDTVFAISGGNRRIFPCAYLANDYLTKYSSTQEGAQNHAAILSDSGASAMILATDLVDQLNG